VFLDGQTWVSSWHPWSRHVRFQMSLFQQRMFPYPRRSKTSSVGQRDYQLVSGTRSRDYLFNPEGSRHWSEWVPIGHFSKIWGKSFNFIFSPKNKIKKFGLNILSFACSTQGFSKKLSSAGWNPIEFGRLKSQKSQTQRANFGFSRLNPIDFVLKFGFSSKSVLAELKKRLENVWFWRKSVWTLADCE